MSNVEPVIMSFCFSDVAMEANGSNRDRWGQWVPMGSNGGQWRARATRPTKQHNQQHTTYIMCVWCVVICLFGESGQVARASRPTKQHNQQHTTYIMYMWCVVLCINRNALIIQNDGALFIHG